VSRCRRLLCPFLTAVAFLAAAPIQAAPFTQGNILVTSNQNLLEYTRTGTLVQTIPLPTPGDGGARGVVLDANGNAQIYNGTFNAFLTTYDPNANSFSNHTLAGLSTVNNVTYGGAAVFGNFVFLSDMFTFGGGEPNGIVRFDTANNYAAVRFPTSGPGSGDYIQLTVGLDGLLYGLGGSAGNNVFDPVTLAFIRSINLQGPDLRGLAVDANGDIFAVNFEGTLFHFDRNGNPINSIRLQTPFSNFAGSTVSLSPNGDVLVAAPSGQIFLTNESLTNVTSFNVAGANFQLFANFVQPPPGAAVAPGGPGVPEPATLALFGAGLAAVLCGRSRRGARA
jgi:hypothetical protein